MDTKDYLDAFKKLGAEDVQKAYDSGKYETLLTLVRGPAEASSKNAAEAEARAEAAREKEIASEKGFRANEKRRSDAEREARDLRAECDTLRPERDALKIEVEALRAERQQHAHDALSILKGEEPRP